MCEEFEALIHNGTWDLIPPHMSQNLVRCKWVFRIRCVKDGTIEHYKSRLIAKGFFMKGNLRLMQPATRYSLGLFYDQV